MANETVNQLLSTVGGTDLFNNPPGLEVPATGNSRGDTHVAMSLPERSELVRMGGSFGAQLKDANQFTLLITIPTTLADLSLQNGEAVGGKSYLIDRVWVKCKTSTASAGSVTILAQVVPPGTTLVADASTMLRYSLSGKVSGSTNSKIAVASTATGAIADRWFPLGKVDLAYTTTIAAYGEALCYGKYIIPPGGNLSLTAQESVSGGAAILGVEWHEVQLYLG